MTPSLFIFQDDKDPGSAHKRKNIKKIIKDKKLTDSTKAAAKAEEDRRKRIQERQKLVSQVQCSGSHCLLPK